MPLTNYRVEVQASPVRLWQSLLDKIQHPQQYVPGVSRTELAELGELSFERAMYLGDGTNTQPLREVISVDLPTKTVIFQLQRNQHYVGYAIAAVLLDGKQTLLDVALHWTPRKGLCTEASDADWPARILSGLNQVRTSAEQGQSPDPTAWIP